MEKQEKKWKQLLGTYKYVMLVLLAGLLLLLWPEGKDEEPPLTAGMGQTAVSAEEGEELERLRREMEEILSAIDGVGQLRLMLTLENDGEKKLAGDSSLRYSGQTASPDDYERTAETVVLSRSGGGEEPVVICQQAPRFRGALVVCEGGGSDAVALQVVHAVSALTGLGSDRIAVVPWAGPTTNMQEAQS